MNSRDGLLSGYAVPPMPIVDLTGAQVVELLLIDLDISTFHCPTQVMKQKFNNLQLYVRLIQVFHYLHGSSCCAKFSIVSRLDPLKMCQKESTARGSRI